MALSEKQVIDVLKQCYDPEVPVDLWNLGLIYNIEISNSKKEGMSDIDIVMSLTTPGCGMGRYMVEDVKTKLKNLEDVNEVNVRVVFDPPWSPDMMTDEAREKLGFRKDPADNPPPPPHARETGGWE